MRQTTLTKASGQVPKDTILTVYDGIGEAAKLCRGTTAYNTTGFYGNLHMDAACDKAIRGATESELAETRALLNKVDAAFRDREALAWVPSPAGAYPMVPEAIIGMPENMRRRSPQESDTAPVRLFVEVVVSAGVQVGTLRKRGAALAALAMRLGEMRPVEMYAVWGTCYGYRDVDMIGLLKIGTVPVSAAEVAFVTADDNFVRKIAFELMRQAANADTKEASIGWVWGQEPNRSDRMQAIRKALDLQPADVFLPGGYLNEAEAMFKDPVKWVNDYLASQRRVDD